MNFGKVDSMEKMFKNYLSGKTLVSKNGEEILKTIVRVENVKCQNYTVFSATLKLFSFAHGTEEINVTVSFDESVSADEIIICPYFSDYFEKSPLPDYGEIIEINDFRKHVETGMFIDDDGCADVLLKNDKYVSTSLKVNELADLVFHPNVKAVIWYNK